jgi:hypothetical protein
MWRLVMMVMLYKALVDVSTRVKGVRVDDSIPLAMAAFLYQDQWRQLFLITEVSGSMHTTTCGNDPSFKGFNVLDKGLEVLLESLSLLVRRHDD